MESVEGVAPVYGGTIPAAIWHDYMAEAVDTLQIDATEFPVPSNEGHDKGAPTPAPSPTPSPTATPTREPHATDQPSPSLSPTGQPSPSDSPSPTNAAAEAARRPQRSRGP
jgi:membrane peptidoglycan carboxypeptidase